MNFFLFCFVLCWPQLVVHWANSWCCTQKSLLVVLGGPCGIPGTKPMLVVIITKPHPLYYLIFGPSIHFFLMCVGGVNSIQGQLYTGLPQVWLGESYMVPEIELAVTKARFLPTVLLLGLLLLWFTKCLPFIFICLLVTLSCTNGLLMTLYSRITPGNSWDHIQV